MKMTFLLLVLGLTSSAFALEKIPAAVTHEDWKGEDLSGRYDVGGILGAGIVDSSVGFYFAGTGALKIIDKGFAPDIVNPVFLETELGPVVGLAAGAFAYSFHLRWDFQKDPDWTFFAMGGLGGDVTGQGLGNHFEIFPRFGIGAFYQVTENLRIRGEVSHEQIAFGVNVPLF